MDEALSPAVAVDYKPDYTYIKVDLLRIAGGDLDRAKKYWEWVNPA